MPRILGIICTYGFTDMPDDFLTVLQSWHSQKGEYQLDVVISDNRSSAIFRDKLDKVCKEFGYKTILTDGDLSVYMTINLAMKLFARNYDFIITASEDIIFTTSSDIQLMLNDFSDSSVASVTIRSNKRFVPEKFNEYYGDRFGITLDKKLRGCTFSPYLFTINEVVCLNIWMYRVDFIRKYNYKLIDKLVHSNFEQHFFLMVLAIGMRMGLCTKATAEHRDFSKRMKTKGKKFGSVNKVDFCDIFKLFDIGKKYGYGFAAKNNYDYMLDETMYKDNKHINPELLYNFLMDNFFLNSAILDYDEIEYTLGPLK